MVRVGEPVDLDVVTDAESEAPTTRRRTRHWPWMTTAIVVVAAVIVFPVRIRVSAAEFDRLDQRWQDALALNVSRTTLQDQLEATSADVYEPRVTDAALALDTELADRLEAIRHRIGSGLIVDPALRRLAATERSVLNTAIAGIRAHRLGLLDPHRVVERQLEDQRSRWHRSPAKPTTGAKASKLHAADGTLAILSRWLDEPTGAQLAVASNGHLTRLDIDHSRAVVASLAPDAEDGVIARRGFVTVIGHSTAWALSTDATGFGPAVRLGSAISAFPALRDDAVWLVQYDFQPGSPAPHMVSIEVNGGGRELTRVVGRGIGETSTGLVELTGDGEAPSGTAIRHLDGSPGPVLTTITYGISVGPSAVGWVDLGTGLLHIWDAGTGAARVIPNPPGRDAEAISYFSPDGSHVPVFYRPAARDLGIEEFGLLEVAPGTVQLVGGVGIEPFVDAAWTGDGQRLFLSRRGTRQLVTYQLGDDQMQTLRLRDLGIGPFAVLLPGA